MICSHIEKKSALSETLTPMEVQHLQTCSHCTAFLRDVQAFKSAPAIETPAQLKSRTLRMSLQQLEAQSNPEATPSYCEQLWQTPAAALLLTGFCILALVVTFLHQLGCDPKDTFCRMSALFLIIVLAQNIIAALCVPLLFQHRNIPHSQ